MYGAVRDIAAAFLLVGIVLTGSRAGYLQVVLLGIATITGRSLLHICEHRLGWSMLALWFITCVMAIAPVTPFFKRHRNAADAGQRIAARTHRLADARHGGDCAMPLVRLGMEPECDRARGARA